MQVSRATVRCLLTGALASVVAISPLLAQGGPPNAPAKQRVHARGQITQVNTEGSTFTIQDQSGAKTFTATAETQFKRRALLTVGDLQSGQFVHVAGKLSEDGASIEASHIGVMEVPQGGQGQRKGAPKPPSPQGVVTGTLQKDGTNLTVTTAEGKTVTIITNEKTRITGPAAASFADLKVGGYAMVMGKTEGETNIALRVVLLPEAPQGQGKGHQGKGGHGKGHHGQKGQAQ